MLLRKGQYAVKEFGIAGEAAVLTYVPGTRSPNLPQTPKWPHMRLNMCSFLELHVEFLHVVDFGSPENARDFNLDSQLAQLISQIPFILGRFSPLLPFDCGF